MLIDADTRRGLLHEMFELPMGPGLTEYLCQSADIAAVIRPTNHSRLSIISSGKRQRRSPELLTSPALSALAAELRDRYEVVLFDTPPPRGRYRRLDFECAAGRKDVKSLTLESWAHASPSLRSRGPLGPPLRAQTW